MAVKSDPPITLPNLLTSIDMSSLTHSELLSLSLLSNTTTTPFSHSPSNDAVSNSFNESGSTHKQTYSDSSPHKLHLHRHRHRHRRRTGLSLLKRERLESNSIVNFLKQYLELDNSAIGGERNKTTRDKVKREKLNVSGVVEIVNRNGVVVDLAALEEAERENEGGPFGAELRRRAAGMEREEELLAMLAEMEGDWCSRRKKRRVVKACLLGDALPVGWKLIIALRRKGGRFSPYCRRYVSPTGEQLASCKEVSSYLQSYFGINDANLLRDRRGELQQLQVVALDSGLCKNSEEGGNLLVEMSNSTVTNNTCVHFEHGHGKDVSALVIDDLPEVQVCDLYECHTCNVSFDVKDKYLQHLLSFHQRTTRRYSLGSSVGEGVTIKDGKYECKICCEVFEDKCRYLGHVGNHVEDSARLSADSPAQVTSQARLPCMDRLPRTSGISKMDALVEIARSSILCPYGLEKEPSSVSNGEKRSKLEKFRLVDTDFQTEKNLNCFPDELEIDKGIGEDKISSGELNPHDKVSEISGGCPNEVEIVKGSGEHKTSLEGLNLPHDKVSDIAMADGDISDSGACPTELEMQNNSDEDRSLSKELRSCDKVRNISVTDRNKVGSISCCNELEIKKDGGENKTLSAELNPHDVSVIDAERKQQASTCNIVDSKNSYFDTMTVPAAKSGLHAVNACESGWWKPIRGITMENEKSADEPKGLLNIRYPQCIETPSVLDGAGEMINSDSADKLDSEHAEEYDDREHAIVYGESHASGCTVPKTSPKSLSTLDGTLGKAGQIISGLDQNLESEIGPEFMELDVIEPQMYNSMAGEDSISLSEVSMGLETNTGLGLGLDASSGSQPEFQLDIAGGGLTTTFCVWCGVEFFHEVADIEPQPDSVGFMCPTCRAKISKQFNELEINFSFNQHNF